MKQVGKHGRSRTGAYQPFGLEGLDGGLTKVLGLSVPITLLGRADRVIE